MEYKIFLNDKYFLSMPECPFEFMRREMDNDMGIIQRPKSDNVVILYPESPGEHVTVAFRLPEFSRSPGSFDNAITHNYEIIVEFPDGEKITFAHHYIDTLNTRADLVPGEELEWTTFTFETHIKP